MLKQRYAKGSSLYLDMKIVIIFLVIIVAIVLHFTVPSISSITACYDNFTHGSDDLGFRVRSQGWNQEKICQVQYDNISILESCINEVHTKAPISIRSYIQSSYKSILRLIRPNVKGIEDQKREHNEVCENFPDYSFE